LIRKYPDLAKRLGLRETDVFELHRS